MAATAIVDAAGNRLALDSGGRPSVKLTDGSNTLTLDAGGRPSVKLTDGVNTQGVGVGTEAYSTTGGGATAAVAAGASTVAQVIKATPGRLCRVLVTATGTAALSIYDNASAASGTVICAIPASAAVGSLYDVQMPAAAGITAGKVLNSPAVTVSYY